MTLATPQTNVTNKDSKMFLLSFIALITALTLWNTYSIHSISNRIAAIIENQAAASKPAAPTPPPPTPTFPTPEQLKLGTSGNGEGVERSFIRELRADPKMLQELAAYLKMHGFTADLTNQGATAHIVASLTGYYDMKFGASVGAKRPGAVSYLIEKGADGTWQVAEYTLGATPTLQHVRPMASSLSQAVFLGTPGPNDEPAQLPPYEFMQL